MTTTRQPPTSRPTTQTHITSCAHNNPTFGLTKPDHTHNPWRVCVSDLDPHHFPPLSEQPGRDLDSHTPAEPTRAFLPTWTKPAESEPIQAAFQRLCGIDAGSLELSHPRTLRLRSRQAARPVAWVAGTRAAGLRFAVVCRPKPGHVKRSSTQRCYPSRPFCAAFFNGVVSEADFVSVERSSDGGCDG